MGDGEVAEAQGERFCAAAAFDELREFELDDVEAGVEEAGGELAGDLAGEDGVADVEGAAGHAGGVEFGDGDAVRGWVGAIDGGVGGGIEGAGIVEQIAGIEGVCGVVVERCEAGVEVIETGVGEVERGDWDVPCVSDVAVGGAAGADAVSGPEGGAGVVEEDVAFAFEGGLAWGLPEEKALADEPAAEEGCLGAALGRIEAGDGSDAVMDERSVADEDHVGTAGLGVQEAHVGDAAEDVVHALPLGEGEVSGGAVNVAGHPGIEDVVDVVPLRRTHEEGGAGELGRWSEDV